MTKRERHQAYLIAVHQRRRAVRVYAVLAPSAAAALARLGGMATSDTHLEMVGGLSRDMVRRLGLELGEMRLV